MIFYPEIFNGWYKKNFWFPKTYQTRILQYLILKHLPMLHCEFLLKKLKMPCWLYRAHLSEISLKNWIGTEQVPILTNFVSKKMLWSGANHNKFDWMTLVSESSTWLGPQNYGVDQQCMRSLKRIFCQFFVRFHYVWIEKQTTTKSFFNHFSSSDSFNLF